MQRHLLVILIGLLAVAGGCDGSSSKEIRYAALGASDALGAGAEPRTNGYVFRISDGLGECGMRISLTNFGTAGASIASCEARQGNRAIAAEPQLITLWPRAE